jgi:cytidyltransferase-like protein
MNQFLAHSRSISEYLLEKKTGMDNSPRQPIVFVTGSFDDLRSSHIRFLQEASKQGCVHVLLYSDEVYKKMNGKEPKYSENERRYYLESIRFVSHLTMIHSTISDDKIPNIDALKKDVRISPVWAIQEKSANSSKEDFCNIHNLRYHIIPKSELTGFPVENADYYLEDSKQKKVVVSGCFDWVHSGHIRFFEEVSAFGDLFVVVGHDQNLKLLKGEGHPMYSQDERRYWVQSIRFVKQALISSGHGWLDAEPEILKIMPDIYVVNEDGDKPEKQNFCLEHHIEYKVLKRQPKPGLPVRISSVLRGF